MQLPYDPICSRDTVGIYESFLDCTIVMEHPITPPPRDNIQTWSDVFTTPQPPNIRNRRIYFMAQHLWNKWKLHGCFYTTQDVPQSYAMLTIGSVKYSCWKPLQIWTGTINSNITKCVDTMSWRRPITTCHFLGSDRFYRAKRLDGVGERN